jgi:hypothetical protein
VRHALDELQYSLESTSCIAEQFARTNRLELLTLPYPPPSVETSMLWHRRLGGQPAHR